MPNQNLARIFSAKENGVFREEYAVSFESW